MSTTTIAKFPTETAEIASLSPTATAVQDYAKSLGGPQDFQRPITKPTFLAESRNPSLFQIKSIC
ncbi:hypothetical protein N7495_002420 [Penicillium taxi]|uniref:uncharacterized protein n=1 Tax=Penicillium taxi TaxID=168475 RepID=UPI00254517DD|nr:uncharacterized protein N7495_002420 [Penicillium taxi]KAJ5901892.1 hypothetical protein N7495_002420 [Penicillium taxi]